MRKSLIIGIGILFLILIYFVVRLNSNPKITRTSSGCYINRDVITQLNFLTKKLQKGADDEMQAIFPEGYLFINALYGLAWANVIITSGKDSSIYPEGIKNIQLSLQKLQSEKGKQIFQYGLSLPYGAFYRGWTNYLLGKMLLAQQPNDRDSIAIVDFIYTCEEIKKAFETSETVYLESYYGARWPADNILCLASLTLHDELFTPKYNTFLANQIIKIKTLTDSIGLIPHSVSENKILEGARGSSQSLINIFLPAIDKSFANQQYMIFKANFMDHRIGLPGIREYPKGKSGTGDIDAGPILWDIRGAASIVAIASASINGDQELSRSLRNSVEAFGVPVNYSNQKRYLFGALPMADVFIAWVNSEVKME